MHLEDLYKGEVFIHSPVPNALFIYYEYQQKRCTDFIHLKDSQYIITHSQDEQTISTQTYLSDHFLVPILDTVLNQTETKTYKGNLDKVAFSPFLSLALLERCLLKPLIQAPILTSNRSVIFKTSDNRVMLAKHADISITMSEPDRTIYCLSSDVLYSYISSLYSYAYEASVFSSFPIRR